ncbi:MAG: phenylalanine--tRNA ligase subunit alpha, partial [Chloroflexi bacterium]|nr:phenylalanine--tRNA ligase subunit alpha [Chloroflexota bacterium]
MLKALEQLRSKALDEIPRLKDLKELEAWRVSYLGRKGTLTQLLRSLSELPIDQRREAGTAANSLKALLETSLTERQEALKKIELERLLQQSRIDVTLPGYPVRLGRLHPTTQILRETAAVFAEMGFEIVEGPEVETDYYNFEALNIPKDHPARDMWDTLWI